MTAQLRPVGWDGPNDAWMPADTTMEVFLASFTGNDMGKLRREGQRRPVPAPRGTAVAAIFAALDTPTVRTFANLRRHSDRDLALAMKHLNRNHKEIGDITRPEESRRA